MQGEIIVELLNAWVSKKLWKFLTVVQKNYHTESFSHKFISYKVNYVKFICRNNLKISCYISHNNMILIGNTLLYLSCSISFKFVSGFKIYSDYFD